LAHARSSRSNRYRVAILFVLGLGACLALVLAWLPIDHTIGRFIYDDMFYYLRVAQFISDGYGSTFDGISSTNGYHPVWMLICVALATIADGDLLVHLALTVAAVLHVLQGYVLSRILLRLSHPAVALCLSVLYVLNWRTVAINMCGLETPLATLLLLMVFYRLLVVNPKASLPHAAFTGSLVGVAALCRFDLLLLVGFVGLWTVLDRRYPGEVAAAQRIKLGSVFGLASLAVLSIWFAFSMAISGTLLPNSRLAVSFLTGVSYDPGNLSQIAAMLVSQAWSAVWWSSDIANLFGLMPIIGGAGGTALPGALMLAILLSSVTVAAVQFRARSEVALASGALAYCFLHASYYVVFHRVELRYILPVLALFFVPLGAVVSECLRRADRSSVRQVAAMVFAVLFSSSAVAGFSAYSNGHASVRVHKYHYVALDVARWLARTHPLERVGAWNAGILGYFSGTSLINLDGVINDDALRAIQAHSIDRYILETGIRFIVDEPGQIQDNLDRFSSGGGSPNWLGPVVYKSTDRDGRTIVVRSVIPH